MISKRELERAIAECERDPMSYASCEKLANFITMYNFYYGSPLPHAVKVEEQEVIGEHGSSDFLSCISGKDAEKVWKLLDEFVASVHVLQPRLYDAFFRKLNDIE